MPDDIRELNPERNRAVRAHHERWLRRDRRVATGFLVAVVVMVAVAAYGVFVYAPNKQVAECSNKDAVRENIFSRRHLVPWRTPAGTICERLTDEQLNEMQADPEKLTAHLRALGVIGPDATASSVFPSR